MSDEVIIDFVKGHKELYGKINKLFKNKARKDRLWESFTRGHKLCKIWCESQWVPWQAHTVKVWPDPKELTDSTGYRTSFSFSNHTSEGRASASPQGSSHHTEDSLSVQAPRMTYPEALQTQPAWRTAFTLTHTSHPFPAMPVQCSVPAIISRPGGPR